MDSTTRLAVHVTGTVQGVGFRPFVFGLAEALGLAGRVVNAGGNVWCVVEGPKATCAEFARRIHTDAPDLADIVSVDVAESEPQGLSGFEIGESISDAEAVSYAIPPDVATCPDCWREVTDPSDRRFNYPFICCTNCGPRFTVVRQLPYDRRHTSMRQFRLCPQCRSEFENPHDRRFHAQTTACADCGPRLTGATIGRAIDALLEGSIVAVKGVGGYQLLCRADRSGPVVRLRQRKHRESKPFALLVDSVSTADRLVTLDDATRRALQSPAAPIVLAPARESTEIVDAVASGTAMLGLMLPATSFHHMLVSGVGQPLVCTSGNRSNEPIIIDDERAHTALAGIADLVLSHDRRIERRADDSVGHSVAGEFQLLRRARGYAPGTVSLGESGPTVLAVGAELKNTTCLATGDRASLSVHLGDLENPATLAAFEHTIADQIAFAGAEVELVVHDLHPEYLSTKFAAAQDLAPAVGVQHHHAHLVSCQTDNGHVGPAIGVVFDGLGWGEDATAWGGEFLVGDARGYSREAHLGYVALPGGPYAVREPWRMAMAHSMAAYGEVPLAVRRLLNLGDRRRDHFDGVAALCADPATLQTSSIGRLFDGVAALCGLGDTVRFEGQAAIALEALATEHRGSVTGYRWPGSDSAPMVRHLVDDLASGTEPSLVARRFHQSVVNFVIEQCRRIGDETGLDTVALSGGVFQNRLLVESLLPQLVGQGFTVLRHRQVPPNDGGIALGQVAIGRALIQARQ